jgi:hypothetical protein
MSTQTERPVYKIFSFYNKEVNPKVPVYQKAVFRHFGFQIQQVFNNEFSHGDFLNYICRQATDTDYLIVFDIDCIPVNKKWIAELISDLKEAHALVGAAQTANHLRDGKNLYISPFFFGISTRYLKDLNYPDMRMTEQIYKTNDLPDAVDAGQNLSEVVVKNGGKLKFWWPTHIEEETWNLYHPEHPRFGLGTTYHDNIYHAFYSRSNLSNRFLEKCKMILARDNRRFIVNLSARLKTILRSVLSRLHKKSV